MASVLPARARPLHRFPQSGTYGESRAGRGLPIHQGRLIPSDRRERRRHGAGSTQRPIAKLIRAGASALPRHEQCRTFGKLKCMDVIPKAFVV